MAALEGDKQLRLANGSFKDSLAMLEGNDVIVDAMSNAGRSSDGSYLMGAKV